jgi:hypothetical protein
VLFARGRFVILAPLASSVALLLLAAAALAAPVVLKPSCDPATSHTDCWADGLAAGVLLFAAIALAVVGFAGAFTLKLAWRRLPVQRVAWPLAAALWVGFASLASLLLAIDGGTLGAGMQAAWGNLGVSDVGYLLAVLGTLVFFLLVDGWVLAHLLLKPRPKA